MIVADSEAENGDRVDEPVEASGAGQSSPADDLQAAGGRQEEKHEDDVLAAEELRGSQVINNFYGRVDAENARFGVSISASARRSTGPISSVEVETIVERYVGSECFDSLVELLREKHIALLVGVDGTGKRTGAIAGLHSVLPPGCQITAQAPSADLGELVVKRNKGYLVADRLDSGAASVQQRFEIERVRDELVRNGSYLVMTLSSAGSLRKLVRELVVEWQPPDPRLLFDRYVGAAAIEDPDLELVRKRVSDLTFPRTVVTIAKAASVSCRDALAALDGSSKDNVRDWFDDESRTLGDVLSAAAAVFAHGVPLRKFEVLHQRLLALGASGGSEVTTSPPLDLGDKVVQSRVGWTKEEGLFVVRRDAAAGPGDPDRERMVVFRADDYREHVIAELSERYGIELWAPVRTWVREIAATAPVSEVQVQVALGLALLCRDSWGEVEESFLDPWSDGAGPERATAAYVLSWMCIDDSLASVALDLALKWVRDGSIRRRITAAAALGSTLGIRYQVSALTWLWHLASRGGVEPRVARQSIALLFCANTAEGEDAGSLLRFIQRGLDTAIDAGRDLPALDAVSTVLAARQPDSGEAAMAAVLRNQPQNVEVIGELWAEALRSGRHRGKAIDALRSTLAGLGGDDVARQVTGRLGEAVRACLTDAEVDLLRRSLDYEFGSAGGGGIADQVTSALLTAFLTANVR
ncbi:hypothetical protein [Lentzea sp. CC55]|uniref:hypothetical protein n=1 Tax=Lentzea sp. CC55 TaxID=2884909 RepID=UPI001F1B3249|nr:hypothetical protein [Lentzea sp. CC55]MCG8924690.1 hypothetical protein [Lentzea sp. CC55]